MKDCIFVTGSNGQIGTELVEALRALYPGCRIIALDIRKPAKSNATDFILANISDKPQLELLYRTFRPRQVYHLAALLSATAEQQPQRAWDLNMQGLLNVLDLALKYETAQVFWPSSIAVFGPGSPKENTPQDCIMDPTTVYGISKLAGERWCAYYHSQYGLDVRSLRYPGIISWKTAPGGGTTDYAVHMYVEAVKNRMYSSYINLASTLPMIYMDDAIRATTELMATPAAQLSIHSSYNLAGTSFSPEEEADSIRLHLPDFKLDFSHGDPRQKIADSWPKSIDDSRTREDWGWVPQYSLDAMTTEMLTRLQQQQEQAAISHS